MDKTLAQQLADELANSKEAEQEEKALERILKRVRAERLEHNRNIVRLREEIVQAELDKAKA